MTVLIKSWIVIGLVAGPLNKYDYSMINKIYLLLISFMLSFAAPVYAEAPVVSVEKSGPYLVSVSHLRNKRYCEVLYGERSFLSLKVKVFSTEGLNECPEDSWRLITNKTITDAHPASFVKLNGPRYWTIDGIEAAGSTVNHEKENFGGIEMNLRATIHVGFLEQVRLLLGMSAYHAIPVTRTTKWIYKAGSPVYELISPSGERYVMQSYAQIVNTRLSIVDLPTLGQQLKLPQGWAYRSRVLTEDLNLVASGIAYVLQDSLSNSYQRQD